MPGEFALIDRLRARVAARPAPAAAGAGVLLGIGDDAALLAPPPPGPDGRPMALAVSADTLNAGVHFPHATAPSAIGHKALAVNLSDLAAMGAAPAWCTLALSLPDGDAGWLDGFLDGFLALADAHGVALAGGDTTRGPLSITLTIAGHVPAGAALRRDGARAGDAVWVTGTLGDAAAGLALALGDAGPGDAAAAAVPAAAGGDAALGAADAAFLRGRLDRPTPRVAAGLALRGLASAALDLSDGLLADLGHLLAASGVGAELDADALPFSPALAAFVAARVQRRERALADGAPGLGVHAADAAAAPPSAQAAAAALRRGLQLSGGDDYELCFTAPADADDAVRDALAAAGVTATRIGRIAHVPGLRLRDADGRPLAPPARAGWDHFASGA